MTSEPTPEMIEASIRAAGPSVSVPQIRAIIEAALAAMPNPEGLTEALVEEVAFAMARVIAYRHGHKPDNWLNDERREEARAAIAALASTRVEPEWRLEMSNPGYCPQCKESGWACRCGREPLPVAPDEDAEFLRLVAQQVIDGTVLGVDDAARLNRIAERISSRDEGLRLTPELIDKIERRMVVLEAFTGKTARYADRDGKWTVKGFVAELRAALQGSDRHG